MADKRIRRLRTTKSERCSAIIEHRWFWWRGKLRSGVCTIVGSKAFCPLTPSQTAHMDARGLFKTAGLAKAAAHKMLTRYTVDPEGQVITIYVRFDKHRGIQVASTEGGGYPYWLRYKPRLHKDKRLAWDAAALILRKDAKQKRKEYQQALKAVGDAEAKARGE